MKKIILASQSPRREMLMRQAGIDFSVMVSGADEGSPEGLSPEEYVSRASRLKARAVSGKPGTEEAVIIGADTVVVMDGQIFGKPVSPEDAFQMLAQLQGNKHWVFTGVTIINRGADGGETEISFLERTEVFMRSLGEDEINSYIETGEPLDKAGGYAIQDRGSILVERIEGDFYNVVGLPIMRTYLALRELGAIC